MLHPFRKANLITRTLAPKNKKHKKKKPASKAKIDGVTEKTNGNYPEAEDGLEVEEHEEPETPTDIVHPQVRPEEPLQNGMKSPSTNGNITTSVESIGSEVPVEGEGIAAIRSPRLQSRRTTMTKESLSKAIPVYSHEGNDTEARLDALAKERATLRDEVTELRKSLEEIQLKHNAELGTMKEQLEDTQGEKDQAETQYRNLLGKVNTIKSQLGERLKADAVRMVIGYQRQCSHFVGGSSPGS